MSTTDRRAPLTKLARTPSAVVEFFCRLAGCEPSPSAAGPVEIQLGQRPGTPTDPFERAGWTGDRAAVNAAGLTKRYSPSVVGANDVSLYADRGEIVAVVGPNGAGKSTTLNMLCGLIRPTDGEATILGIPIQDTKRLSTVLGVALQVAGLDPAMTGLEHFQVQAALYRMSPSLAQRRTALLLEAFGLSPYVDRQVAQFSVGLQRRLVVALSLLHDPAVILMDEPTAGLDPQSRRMVWGLLRDLRDEGRTIIFSTQLLEEADLLAQRMYVISDGNVIAHGTPAELRKEYGELTIRIRAAGPPAAAVEMINALRVDGDPARLDGEVVVVPAVTGDGEARQILTALNDAGIEVVEFALARPSLEDAFVELTGAAVRPEPVILAGGPGVALCRCG